MEKKIYDERFNVFNIERQLNYSAGSSDEHFNIHTLNF